MIVEIYGIPEEVGRCPGCYTVTKLLKELRIDYSFYPVISNAKTGNGIEFNKPLIQSLAKRAGFPGLNIRYPVIFLDDKKMRNIKHFKEALISLGYDKDIIEE